MTELSDRLLGILEDVLKYASEEEDAEIVQAWMQFADRLVMIVASTEGVSVAGTFVEIPKTDPVDLQKKMKAVMDSEAKANVTRGY